MSSPGGSSTATGTAPAAKGGHSLYLQVIVAIVLGIAVGRFAPEWGKQARPLGDGFLKLIKMLVAPVVFCTVVHGIAGVGDMKRVGRVGVKALVWFEGMTTLALGIGLAVMHLVRPGDGMNVDVATLDPKAVAAYAGKSHGTTAEFLLSLIPDTLVGAFAHGEMLQVLVVALLFGTALGQLGERGREVLHLVESLSQVLFRMVGLVMKAAPFGAFGAMAFTIGTYGLESLASLGTLMATFYGTALLFVFVVLGAVMRLLGLSIVALVRYLSEELLLVLGTSSSEAALPRMLVKLEALGAAPEVVGLVVPTGYAFNLDGTCIYLTMAALFLGQACNVPLTLGDELGLLGVLLVSSKGAAAVTGGGFITLAATLATTGKIPVASLALLLGIDRFMSEARALTNLLGNAVATLVVARWEGRLDLAKARAALAGGAPTASPTAAGDQVTLDPRP